MGLRKLVASEVSFEEKMEPEDIPVEDIFATDDEEQDRQDEQDIRDRLRSGCLEAWCILVVKARWESFEGTAVLGGCSYQNAPDAREDFEQLRNEALEDLNKSIESTSEKLDTLKVS